jgi:hypothetical protein
VWLGRSPDASPRPGQSLSSGPSTDPTAPTVAGPLPLDALPLGQKPGIDYMKGDTYVTMNGNRITDAVFGNATTATPARGGILVSVPPGSGLNRQGGIAGTYLVSDAGHQYLGCGSDRFAMSTDGVESAYWLADSCPVGATVGGALYSGVNNTMGESGPGHVATPVGSQVTPVGIVQQGTVVNVTHGGSGHTEIVDASGTRTPIAALAYAGGSDESNDVVSGQLAGDSSTGAVVDAATGAVKVRVPGWILGQFSIDGKYVVGIQRTDSVFGDSYAIFDAASGHRLIAFAAQSDPVWDTDDTLLSIGRGTNTTAIVRTDLQGNWTRATPIVHSTSYWAGYRLATRP